MKGMTLQEPPDSERRSAQASMRVDGLDAVDGTRGIESAMAAQNQSQCPLVQPNTPDQQHAHHVTSPAFLARLRRSATTSAHAAPVSPPLAINTTSPLLLKALRFSR